ncbi:CBP3 Protein CBP3 [Candida maltosa Xu316]|uniref:Ubiquinol-cytochrome c chaperone domain-containing protein n=1 Tax=Candida maltosa (strain Xu316) TaxID=1245528 RepID=M3K4L3_CANMX|nr:hypothetical protein G210_4769 [Candida maltosa Xu316]
MLRISKGSTSSIRLLSQSTRSSFQNKRSILSKYEKKPELDLSPNKLASESHIPFVKQNLYKKEPRQPQAKAPFLSEQEDNYTGISGWREKLGQFVVSTFGIDMDKSRSGPVAGGKYFGECKKQALFYPDEPLSDSARFYYETLKLPQSFSQQVQIMILHYWILSVRMRALPYKYGKEYQQKLVDRIFSDMELRMSTELKIKSGRTIENYMKDYHTQLLGCVLSYDEGLMTDDITLASALWRNVFNGNENVDLRHVEALLMYVRSQLYVLNKMTDRAFGFGYFSFVPADQIVKLISKEEEEMIKEATKKEFAGMTLPSQQSVLSMDE